MNKKTYERWRQYAKRTEMRREKEGETMREKSNKEREREDSDNTKLVIVISSANEMTESVLKLIISLVVQ